MNNASDKKKWITIFPDMPIIVSPDILSKLEHDIPEIRYRALCNVISKLVSCRVDLDNLVLNVHDLISRLFNWFNFKPVTHQKHIFDILLSLLKSKYFRQAIQILSKYSRHGDLKNIGRYANDEITRTKYNELLSIIENNDNGIENTPRESEAKKSKENLYLSDNVECNELHNGLQFETAWNVVELKDKQRLLSLKTSLSSENDVNELDHAMEFFKQSVHDFPGEYFLQSPFIFVDLLRLLQSKERNVDKTNVLTSILYLTKNISRRVSIRRISLMHCRRKTVSQQQVTIASYSISVFSCILDYLRQHYTILHLMNLNECLLVLIEIIELICKSAVEYTPQKSVDYSIEHIISELTDFLRFLRETTMNYRRSSNKIDRNTSISILYLLCRLVLFKDNNQSTHCTDDINDSLYPSPSTNISTKNLSQRLKGMSLTKDVNAHQNSPLSNRSYFLDLFQSTINDEISTSPSTVTENVVTETLTNSEIHVYRQELETALFDYPLSHYYPDVHELVSLTLKVESLPSHSTTKVLLNLDKLIKPMIPLLKDPHICSDEFILKNSSQSIDILPLIKSDGLTALIFNAISNLCLKYGQNPGLLDEAEKILLSLLSTECSDTKRLIYKMISDKITHVFSHYMDGTMIIPKIYNKNANYSIILGLPITTDILVEIISFGLTNTSSQTTQYAENILLIILRSAKDLNDNLIELLVPALPLLSCFSNSSSTIGRIISTLFEPNVDNAFSTVQLFKNNIVQLFGHDPNIRNEAITRLLYLLQCLPNSDKYVPNINYLSSVIPDNVCLVKPKSKKCFEDFVDLFERSLAKQLLEDLSNHRLDAPTRQTILNQLNIMMEDLSIAEEICQNDGVRVIYEIWERSLRNESVHDYTIRDAKQIVGILSKISQRIPPVRRRLSNDIQTYNLLIRTLLSNVNDDGVKQDCASLLFLLAFTDYIIGCVSQGQLSIPIVCKKLSVPIDYQFNTTFNMAMKNHQGLFELVSTMMNSSRKASEYDSINVFAICNERPFLRITDLWRYTRMTFASLWFGALDKVLIESDESFQIEFKLNEQSMQFNKSLCMTRSDLEIIKATSPHIGIQYWQKQIQNAASMNRVVLSCAAIENFSTIDSLTVKRQWNVESFLQAIKRFCTIAPRNKQDEFLFSRICRLLAHLINQEYENIHTWILYQLQEDCVYINLMNNTNASTAVYLCNIRFIESVISKAIQLQTKKSMHQVLFVTPKVKSAISERNNNNNNNTQAQISLFERILNIAVNLLDELLNLKKSEELFQMISLIRTLTLSGQITANEYECSYVANKLMKLVMATKAFTQIGSNFNKNCLLAIDNLMLNIDELRLEQKYISLLSSLCGHCDFEIRAYTWSILLKMSTSLKGAELLVRELKSLPGGFYACCVSTLLDETESAIVRENAAFVFAALISHQTSDGYLKKIVVPNSVSTLDNYWLERLLELHQFFDKTIDSINYLHLKETINPEEISSLDKIVPCNLIRSYCVVLTHLIHLRMENGKAKVITAMLQIYKILPRLAESINKSTVLLIIELCNLMSTCISKDSGLIEQISSEFKIVHSLISCLNIKPFESISEVIKNRCWSRIFKILRGLVYSPMGFQIMCESFAQNPIFLEEAGCLFIYSLASKEINITVMKYITTMLITSQSNTTFPNFSELLNSLKITRNVKESIQSFFYKSNVISQTLGDWLESAEHEKNEISFTNVLYEQLTDSFEKYNDMSTAKILQNQKDSTFEYLCHLFSTMLKSSRQFRDLATSERFVLTVVQQMEQIYHSIDGSFTEYVRRNGSLKAEPFLDRLEMLLSIVVVWYSSDCLQNIDSIEILLCICQKFWPTIGINADLQLRMMNMLLFISDDSLPVCKQLASNGSLSCAFLQSIIDYAINETSKAKTSLNLTNLEFALKIVSNCCSCIEGRILVNKLPMLDTLNRLHPQVTRNQKPWPQITLIWLELFEVLTRYEDSNKATHINLLVNFAESSSKRLRQQALEILRNMTFNTENRNTFLCSKPFINIVILTLDRNISAEQLLVIISIWKLIANNHKAKNVIKNSPIYQKLLRLKESVDCGSKQRFIANPDNQLDSSNEETTEDLLVALKCVTDILQA